MTALVTGAAGFAGRHLCQLLQRHGDTVHAMISPSGNGGPVPGASEHFTVDLQDFSGLVKLLDSSRPGVIFHLAALSSPEQSWKSRRLTYETNFLGTLNLIEAVLASGLQPRLLLVGSGAVYGAVPASRQPITEAEPFAPRDPYGVSKAAQELLGRQCVMAHGLDAVLLRPFNHTGPGQGPGFVCSDFARQVAAIEAGRVEPYLRIGNLEARRDFTDVRDTVEAYRLAAVHGRAGEAYNIGSGRAWGVSEILERLVALARVPIEVRVDPERLRPLDNPLVVCDAAKFRREAGWEPRRDFLAETLPDLLESWRERIRKGEARGL
jgi:GDP-4-dehydro-6-deoxy-D-mannose reductase